MRSLPEDLADPGPETLRRFVRDWHGIDRTVVVTHDGEWLRPLVRPLVEWWDLLGTDPPFVQFNRILTPGEIARDGDRVVFYEENQTTHIWATDAIGHDPKVWLRENEPNAAWIQEEEPMSRFLLQVAMFETVMSSTHSGTVASISRQDADAILKVLISCRLAPWRWPYWPTTFHVAENLLIVAGPNPGMGEVPEQSEYLSLFVAGRTEESLSQIDRFVTPEWDYFSPRDGQP